MNVNRIIVGIFRFQVQKLSRKHYVAITIIVTMTAITIVVTMTIITDIIMDISMTTIILVVFNVI